jgi:polyhydroxybutyrate depolymerase
VSLAVVAASGCGDAEGTGLEGAGADSDASGAAASGGSANGGRTGNSGGGRAGATDAGGAGASGGTAGRDPDSGGSLGEATSGCGRAPAFESGVHELEVGGLTRTFIVDVPDDYSEDQPYPVVFGFHGRDFSAAEFRGAAYGNLPSAAGDEAVLVHPDATNAGAWELESEVDIEYFDALLDALTRGLCLDGSRVFATGHSSGGYFTNRLGCERGDVLRGIAPVAGGIPAGTGEESRTCQRPVSAWIAHGEQDETVPFVNGEESLEYWLGRDDCDAASAEAVSPDPCVAYACAGDLSVHWCAHADGHDWPDFAASAIWRFFQSL